jgi:hypothetical protein
VVLVLGAVGVLFLLVSYGGTVWALLDAVRRRARGNDLAGTWVVFLAVSLIAPPLTGLVGALYGLFGRPKIRAEQEQREQRYSDRRPGVVYAVLWVLGLTFLFVATAAADDVESTPERTYADELAVARERAEACLGTGQPGEANYALIGMREDEARRILDGAGWQLRVIGRDDQCDPGMLDAVQRPDRIHVYLVEDRIVWARQF